MTVKNDPTPEQTQELRDRISAYAKENEDAFDPVDVRRFMLEDALVRRYFIHVYSAGGNQMDNAYNMIVNSFKWRNENQMRYIKESDLDKSLCNNGVLFIHNRDVDGKKLFVFNVGKHSKGKNKEELKKIFLYFVERLEKEEKGDFVTMFFDCQGAGLSNFDLEFVTFMIGVFKDYIPENLNYIVVYCMPWVLNAGFSIIKKMLPAEAVAKIKFIKKDNTTDYVSPAQRLVSWGGEDTWDPCFEPETKLTKNPTASYLGLADNSSPGPTASQFNSVSSEPEDAFTDNNNEAVIEMKRKTVHFNSNSVSSKSNGASRSSSFVESGPRLLSLQPSEEVVFVQSGQGDLVAKVMVTNVASKPVALKIKTTSPDKYRVRPSMTVLAPNAATSIEIFVQSAQIGNAASLVRDKFLITALTVQKEDHTQQQLGEIMKSEKPEGQYRLRCTLEAGVDSRDRFGTIREGDSSSSKQSDTIDKLTKKVTSLVQAQEELQKEVNLSKMLLYALLILATLTFLLLFWRTHNLASICVNSSAAVSNLGDAVEEAQQEAIVHDEA